MESVADDVEATIQRLCAEASAERDQVKLRDVRSRLELYLHEHGSILTSMSEDTYQALRKLKPVRRRSPKSLPRTGIRGEVFRSRG